MYFYLVDKKNKVITECAEKPEVVRDYEDLYTVFPYEELGFEDPYQLMENSDWRIIYNEDGRIYITNDYE